MKKPRTYKRSPDLRPSPEARGYDKEWFKARARHKRANPHCIMCLAEGRETKAEHVDHIISIRQRPDLRLDPKNWQSLCAHHHDLITQSIDGGDLRGAVDVEGNPLDPNHPWAQATAADAMRTVNTPFKPNFNPPEGVTRLLKRQALGARK